MKGVVVIDVIDINSIITIIAINTFIVIGHHQQLTSCLLPIYYCNLFNRWKYNCMGIMYVPSLFLISAQLFNTNLISGVLPSFWSTASSIRSALKKLLRKQCNDKRLAGLCVKTVRRPNKKFNTPL